MIYYALVFLVVALIAGVLGFSGIAGTAAKSNPPRKEPRQCACARK